MNRKPKILFVDDEDRILRSLAMMFKYSCEVSTCNDPIAASEMIQNNQFDVIVSDQRMPNVTGIELLQVAKRVSPNSVRILLTGYADINAILGSINEGEIFRYVTKPWDPQNLRETLARAAEIAMAVSQSPNKAPTIAASSKHRMLIVEESTLGFANLSAVIGGMLNLDHARNLNEAIDMLTQKTYDLMLTDVRVKGENTTGLIKSLKHMSPKTLTLVLSSIQDSAILIELINQGQVYRYLPRPLRPAMLQNAVNSAVAYSDRLHRNPILLRQHEVAELPDTVVSNFPAKLKQYFVAIKSRFAPQRQTSPFSHKPN